MVAKVVLVVTWFVFVAGARYRLSERRRWVPNAAAPRPSIAMPISVSAAVGAPGGFRLAPA